MDVGAERHNKVAYLPADAVLLCTLEVNGYSGGGGLGADGGGIAGDLVADEDKGVLSDTAPATRNWMRIYTRCMIITTRKTFRVC